jgi:serine/threonine protein kinase
MMVQQLAGKFELQKEIGQGQTGTVYYGYDIELRQEMAIKIYRSHINGKVIRGILFKDKAQPLLRLEHPNLIKIFKIEEENTAPVVCMEFFDAPNLQQVIQKEGPLPLDKVLLLSRDIAEVLVHTHKLGIIHGSLHPGHVLVNPQGKIKILDFGLSWILMDILSSQNMHLLRPLPYLLPEMAKGELLDLSSDLYSLGFMMYHMLTTRVPYAGLPKTSIMGKLAFDQTDPDFDFPDTVPEAVCHLIRQITRNQSQHRLHEATQVLTILNQQLERLAPREVFNAGLPSAENPLRQENPHFKVNSPLPVSQPPAPVPALRQSSEVYQPKHSIASPDNLNPNGRKRLSISLGIILMLAGMTIGYWYTNVSESLSPKPEASIQKTPPVLIENEPSTPTTDFYTIHPTPIPDPPLLNNSMTENPRYKSNSRQEEKSSIPTPKGTASIQPSEMNIDKVVTPSLPSQDTTSGRSPVSAQDRDSEISPIPEQRGDLQPPISSETIMAPDTRPAVAPENSSFLSGMGQEEKPVLEKQSSPQQHLPSEPSGQTRHDLLKSAPASLTNDVRKDSETGRKLPADPQIPTPPPPSASSAPSSSGSVRE